MAIWQPLVVCGKTPGDGVPTDFTSPCEFDHLILLAKNLITNLVILSTFLAVAVFIFAAIKLLTSGGKTSAMEDAKKMLGKVIMGYIWILVAWLLVYTITSTLLYDNFNFILGRPK